MRHLTSLSHDDPDDLAYRLGKVSADVALARDAWTLEVADVGYLAQNAFLAEQGTLSELRRRAEQAAFLPGWRP